MPSSRRSSSRIGGEGGGGRARKGHSLSLSHHIGERLDAQKERPGAATAGNRWSEPPRCVSQHIFWPSLLSHQDTSHGGLPRRSTEGGGGVGEGG